MPDNIYLVNPVTKATERFDAISFSALGIKERGDLQEWVLRHPQMLGEELLVLTSEFNKFDNSNKRLDILALDSDGKLVIVELKLDAHDSLAELQAIRYAAFCATMTMDDAITARAGFFKESQEAAADTIREFLEADDLPELDSKPRIIIAAGSMDDQELTSTALWLRSFGLDITCVELTPYHLTDPDCYVLVPRVIIPIPEAKEYLVSVQRKEVAQQQAKSEPLAPNNSALWQAVAAAFNGIAPKGFMATGKARGWYMQVKNPPGLLPTLDGSGVHYEWLYLGPGKMSVALHFETKNAAENDRLFQVVLHHASALGEGIPHPFGQGDWKSKWRDLRFLVSYPVDEPLDAAADRVARVMALFIERSSPLLQQAFPSSDVLITGA